MRFLALALVFAAASATARPPDRDGFVVTPAMEAVMTRDGQRVYDTPLAWVGWDLKNGVYVFAGLALSAAKEKLAEFQAECSGGRRTSCEGLDRLRAWTAWLGSHSPHADECVEDLLPGAFAAVHRAASAVAGVELSVTYEVFDDLPGAIAEYQGEPGSGRGVVLIDRGKFCARPPAERVAVLSHEFGHAISYARKSNALYSLRGACMQFNVFGCTRALNPSTTFEAWSLRQAEVEATAYGMLVWQRTGRTVGDFKAAFLANAGSAQTVAEHLRRAEQLSAKLQAD